MPSVVVNIVDSALNVADTTSVVTFTFSEAPVGFTAADITAANGTVTNLQPTADPLVFTATFTASSPFEGTGSVSVSANSYSNAVGNLGGGSTDTVGIDTKPPAPTITLDANITADDIISVAEAGQTIPVTGVVGGDAKVGDTVTLTVNGKDFTGLVQPGKTFSINVPGADLAADPDKVVDAKVTTTDAAGNTASATDTEGYTGSNVPSVVVNIVDSALNVADTTSVVTFTFSEAPVGFTAADITAANGTVTNLQPTADPLVFTATFTASSPFEGTGSVSVSANSYSNAVGNLGGGSTDTVGIDTKPPAPTITLDANITADDIISVAEAGQSIPVTGVVGGDAKVGDTVTLTVNGKDFTGLVLPGKTFSINVPGADLAADPDKVRTPKSRPRMPLATPPARPTPKATPAPTCRR
ncbi:MAG: Ig-like domain-containing protein [Dechloromonas sp.]|uniref:Ig-like domain-containing protein n=1 Tax=Candidatus Dechloromonas phosphorivorans TaxID=2899244 RepID=A0A935K3B7_9RHOO|nr:Ig-like domain-containing protein [Candidatus Dechloromonas phosphorivorans]